MILTGKVNNNLCTSDLAIIVIIINTIIMNYHSNMYNFSIHSPAKRIKMLTLHVNIQQFTGVIMTMLTIAIIALHSDDNLRELLYSSIQQADITIH